MSAERVYKLNVKEECAYMARTQIARSGELAYFYFILLFAIFILFFQQIPF